MSVHLHFFVYKTKQNTRGSPEPESITKTNLYNTNTLFLKQYTKINHTVSMVFEQNNLDKHISLNEKNEILLKIWILCSSFVFVVVFV
jgi:hypothetical protein